jgi:hypothetical protein
MICPFYGKAASEMFTILSPTGGNQCALITGRHSPCVMELAGKAPELANCEWSGSQRAIEFADYPTSRSQYGYPD